MGLLANICSLTDQRVSIRMFFGNISVASFVLFVYVKFSCFPFQDIKSLFPPDCNPFYAGFGNRDTDEFSYLKVGIPLGKIFIINPKVIKSFMTT